MNINYTLKRSRKRRKTLSLQISRAAEIVVSAPYFTPGREINRFVQEKQGWIDKTIQKHNRARHLNKEKEYISGEYFYYLGESFPLEVFFEPKERTGLVFWNKRFHLNAPEDRDMKKYFFFLWYKKKAFEYISGRVDLYCHKFNLKAHSVRITSAQKRWGSCSEDNNLTFSFRLIMAPPEIIDYVIVHEIMHIKEKSHAARFWKLVEEVMPEYKTHRRWLKECGETFLL
jgi:predicted metal-dependent hydrolase